MRPAEFAPELIIEAGQALQAAGRNITGFALRQRVGGGNPARLRQIWDEFIASQSVSVAEPVIDLPVEVADEVAAVSRALTERLMALAIELNTKAVKAAERRVHEVERSAEEQRAQTERELADAAQAVDDLETSLEATRAEVTRLGSDLTASQAVSQAQTVELAQLHERLAGMDVLRTELAESRQAQQELAAERAQLRALYEGAKARAERSELAHEEHRRISESESRSTVARLQLSESDKRLAEKEAREAREEAASLRGQVKGLQARIGADGQTQELPLTPSGPGRAKKASR